MFRSKNGHFSKFFFLAIWTKKCLSWVLKQEVSKSRKIDIFLKGLTHGFGPKMAIFPIFFLRNRDKKNVFYDILQRKNPLLVYKNKKFKKSKKWHFSKGVNPWFLSKNGHFSKFFFLGNIEQENVFYDILERKNAFLGYKNKKFKKSKNWHFSKGVNPWFGLKIAIFSTFLLMQYRPGKYLLWYSRTKKMRF